VPTKELRCAGTPERSQSDGDVIGPVGQSADHADIRVTGCHAQRGPTETRPQPDRADRRRSVRPDAIATEPPSQPQQPLGGRYITHSDFCLSRTDGAMFYVPLDTE